MERDRREFKATFERIYHTIGGEESLERILLDFYQRMSKDIIIEHFFVGKDLAAIAKAQKSFLMRAMGVSPTYSGKAPALAHLGLADILTGHFDRRLRILEQTLKDHGLSDADIRTWIAFEEVFRASIVK